MEEGASDGKIVSLYIRDEQSHVSISAYTQTNNS